MISEWMKAQFGQMATPDKTDEHFEQPAVVELGDARDLTGGGTYGNAHDGASSPPYNLKKV